MTTDTMRLDTKPGERIRFTGEGGFAAQNTHAREILTIGEEYYVLEVEVGGWMSYVRIPEGKFNTVLFENCDG